MSLHVFLVGSTDRQLEQLLAVPGSRVTALPAAELTRLAAPDAEQPDVVVLDLRADPQLPLAVWAVKRQHQQTPVIIVAAKLDPALMLDAMRAGVNECVTEPLTTEGMATAISRVVHQVRAATGETFAFVGAKGGVGTTTLAINAATALAKSTGPGRVLFIDLHLMGGDASMLLGAEPRFSVLDALDNVHRFDEAFFRSLVVKTRAGVDLLSSSDRAAAGTVTPASIRALMDLALRLYRHVVLDVPRSDATVIDSLDAVARFIIVANQELATVRSAGRTATSLRQRYGAGRVSVVLSRFDANAPIGRQDVEKATGAKVTHTFPSDYRRVIEALNQGQPLVLGNHSALAGRIVSLANDLAGLERQAPPPAERRGLFGRMAGRK